MTRGFFNSMQHFPEYDNAEKSWHITLDRSDFFWYDLVVKPPSEDAGKALKKHLNDFKKFVELNNEKRFIYFFTSRKKVRFDIKKQPSFLMFSKKKMYVHLLIGNKVKKKVGICFPYDIPGKVVVDEKFIYLYDENGNSIAYSVHDFLKICKINLGIDSELLYVGITEDPVERTLGRKHRGLTDILYSVPTSENDIFLTINTFKVGSYTNLKNNYINIMSTNSMIYDIPLDKEGLVIEKALIYYFKSEFQEIDKKAWGEFRNLLTMMKEKKNICSVSFHLELNEPTEYDVIGSKDVKPRISHSFLWQLNNNEPSLMIFNNEIDIMKYQGVLSDI